MDEFINMSLHSIEKKMQEILLEIHAIIGYWDAIKDFTNGYEFIARITSDVQTKTIEMLKKASIVKVPCFIGDTVYHIGRKDKKVHISMVKRIVISRNGIKVILHCGKKGIVGKDIFLTEQEAKTKQII